MGSKPTVVKKISYAAQSRLWNLSTGQIVSQLNFGSPVYNLSRGRTGFDRPNYKQVISNGGDATNALDAWDETMSYSRGQLTARYYPKNSLVPDRVGKSDYIGAYPAAAFPAFPSSVTNEAIAIARTKAFKRLQELQTPKNGQVLLGEAKETIDLLKHPFETSQKLLMAFKGQALSLYSQRRSTKNTYQIDRQMAASWLELRFGILPLIGEVKDMLKIITELDLSEVNAFRVSGTSQQAVSRSFANGTGLPQVTIHGTETDYFLSRCSISCGLKLEADASIAQSKATKLVDSLSDLSLVPSTAWELTPYSWLVDYFVNVGDIIESATVGRSILSYCSETTVNEIRTDGHAGNFSISKDSNYDCAVLDYIPSSWSKKSRRVSRRVGSLAIPPIVFELPGSNIRLANIAALLSLKL